MTTYYAQVSDIVREFGRNAVNIDSNTQYSSVDLATVITRSEDEIDTLLGRTFRPSIPMKAPDGTGLLRNIIFSRSFPNVRGYYASFTVPIWPIQAIGKVEFYIGGPGYTDMTSNVNNENRPNGIWFDPNGKEVYIGSGMSLPVTEKDAVRIQYTAGLGTGGYQSVPSEITDACIYLTMSKFAQSERWSFSVPNGAGVTNISDKAREWRNMAFEFLNLRRGVVWS